MIRHLVTPPDLGDILGVRVGDRVAVLHIERGRLVVSVGCRPVTEVDDTRVMMKRDKFLKVNGGAASYGMHDQGVAHFYYSANPVHIAEADRKAREVRVGRERVERRAARRRAAVGALGEMLGDGEHYDSYGEPYGDTTAADLLIERLTVAQIETLKGWLKE